MEINFLVHTNPNEKAQGGNSYIKNGGFSSKSKVVAFIELFYLTESEVFFISASVKR